jgi:glycosyltransferase involved in cell wall biosynthesis
MTRPQGMKILMTTDAVGGVWTFTTCLASALAARGIQVHLVTLGPRPGIGQHGMLRGSGVHVTETDLALEWQDPEGKDVPVAREALLSLAREIKPDLVHLNSYREATFDWPAPVVVTAHSCVKSWALACGDTGWLSEPRWRSYTEYVTAGLNHADSWIAPTNAFRHVMQELYRPQAKGNVIWNGLAAAGARSDKQPFILAAGRMWDAAKNLTALTSIAKSVDWPIAVAGAQPDQATRTSALAFLGEVSHADLNAQMECAAIFVSPARYEPFGLAVLEAAGAGCALVLSDIPTFRELWDGCASFVDLNEAGALQAALNDLCANSSKRSALQQGALARAGDYTTCRMVDHYAQAYDALIAPLRARPALEACA